MSEQEVKGKLAVVATTAGIKLEVEGVVTEWINPSKEAKDAILQNIKALQDKKGEMVSVSLDENKKYTAIVVLEGEAGKKEEEALEKLEEALVDAGPDKLDETGAGVPTGASHVPEPERGEEANDDVQKMRGVTPGSATITKMSFKTIQCHCECHMDTLEEDEQDYFEKLNKTEGETKKLGHHNLTYMSWATAWEQLKKQYPGATYRVWEDHSGMPYFSDQTGAFCKVTVRVAGVSHTVHLPVMDNHNKAIKGAVLDSMNINKTIQRCMCKAIAMHGMGLYVYRGEDLPDGADKK